MNTQLSPNALAFIALTNEYCHILETCEQIDRFAFIKTLLKLLPRIYITANDLAFSMDDEGFVEPINESLDENTYDLIRQRLSVIMAEDDVYLDTFLEDMRYSDTPVSVYVSENLADLYQMFFNFVHSVQDMTTEVQQAIIDECLSRFRDYWGQTLCNVMRALHNTFYNI